MSSHTQAEFRWWEDPDRVCAGDERYADLSLVKAMVSPNGSRDRKQASRKEKIEEMQRACLTCPVYYECLGDLERYPSREFYGVRAGLRGKS